MSSHCASVFAVEFFMCMNELEYENEHLLQEMGVYELIECTNY